MIEYNVEHHIEKYIMSVLYRSKTARFRDLRKPNVETNLFSYHLKLLIRHGFVKKIDGGYTLGEAGLSYVDRVSEANMSERRQPKIITMIILQNSNGEILLQKRTKQPYIDLWTLPYGKLHIEDGSISAAAEREALEKIGLKEVDLKHVGDCYIRVIDNKSAITTTMAHIFKGFSDDVKLTEKLTWVHPRKLQNYELAPAVEKIIARTFFGDPYFFEEFTDTLN